jgi:transposase
MPKRTRKRTRVVIGGVDTHGRAQHAAVIDQQGRLLGDREFPADSGGYRQLLGWLGRHGNLDSVGVEGTGSYGAGLTRFLLDRGVGVVEVDRPDRRLRRQRGKSDPIDAEAAARAVLAGVATAPRQAARRHRGVAPGAARGAQRRDQGPDRRDQPAQGPAGHRAGAAAGGAGRPLHPGVGRRLRPVAPGRDRPGQSP